MPKTVAFPAVATPVAFYSCEAAVLPDLVEGVFIRDGVAPAEQLGDEFSVRHALASFLPVYTENEMTITGYDVRGLAPVYFVDGGLPLPYSQLGGARVLRVPIAQA